MKSIQEVFEQCYKNIHPKLLAGDLNNLRFSAPEYAINLMIDLYEANFRTFDRTGGKINMFGIQVIPCQRNEITIFHIDSPRFEHNADYYYSVSLNATPH